jgi:hypothetical protein
MIDHTSQEHGHGSNGNNNSTKNISFSIATRAPMCAHAYSHVAQKALRASSQREPGWDRV